MVTDNNVNKVSKVISDFIWSIDLVIQLIILWTTFIILIQKKYMFMDGAYLYSIHSFKFDFIYISSISIYISIRLGGFNMKIELITGFLFLALSILFLLGKGSFLIAGYNTSSKAEKAKYDEKKICRYAGIAMLMASIGQFILLWNKNLMWLTLLVSFVAVVVAIVGANFFSKKKAEDINETEIKQEDDKASKVVKIGSIVFTLIILAGIGGLLFAGDVNLSVGKNAVEINAFMASGSSVDYTDIKEVYLSDDVHHGSRVGGFGGLKISSGNFENDKYGRYKLYAYNDNDTFIVVKTNEDKYIVFNQSSQKNTEKVYESILEKVN